MENPFIRISNEQIKQEQIEFEKHVMTQDSSCYGDIELQVAERNYRKPIQIIGEIYLMPFWRNGKEAPLLPKTERGDGYARSDL